MSTNPPTRLAVKVFVSSNHWSNLQQIRNLSSVGDLWKEIGHMIDQFDTFHQFNLFGQFNLFDQSNQFDQFNQFDKFLTSFIHFYQFDPFLITLIKLVKNGSNWSKIDQTD